MIYAECATRIRYYFFGNEIGRTGIEFNCFVRVSLSGSCRGTTMDEVVAEAVHVRKPST